MPSKNKNLIVIQRIVIWITYIYSGFILYSQQGYIFTFLMNFSKVIYPLSIFWLQIRIKRKENFLPINSSMSTSQLWFSILPVLSCLITVICTTVNGILFILNKF